MDSIGSRKLAHLSPLPKGTILRTQEANHVTGARSEGSNGKTIHELDTIAEVEKFVKFVWDGLYQLPA